MTALRRTAPTAAALSVAAVLALAVPAWAHEPGHGHQGAAGSHREHASALLLRAPIAGSVPADPTLFGVAPGALPWVITSGSASVHRDGRLRVTVDSLVVPTAPHNGTNPLPLLEASLVCNGAVVATTAPVNFSTAGDAEISARVAVPSTCLAPAILLSPGGKPGVYIAATGSAD
jgi:hypothetical protein